MKPRVLITNLVIPPQYLDIYGETFTVHYTPTQEDREKAPDRYVPRQSFYR